MKGSRILWGLNRPETNVPDKPANKRINTDAAVRMCLGVSFFVANFTFQETFVRCLAAAGYARVISFVDFEFGFLSFD